jgi:hypothetical protein
MSFGMNNSMASRAPTGSSQMGNSTGMREKIPSGYRKGTLQQFGPEQMQLFQQLFSHAGPDSYLSKLAGGDQSMFDEIEAPQMKQFAGLQGNIASRFSGMGMGARRSSGFQNTMGQMGSDFAQDLASKRQGLQRQAIMDLMGISGELLGQRPFEQMLTQKKPSFMEQWLQHAGNTMGAVGRGGAMGGF